jgi:hypothetical protein
MSYHKEQQHLDRMRAQFQNKLFKSRIEGEESLQNRENMDILKVVESTGWMNEWSEEELMHGLL